MAVTEKSTPKSRRTKLVHRVNPDAAGIDLGSRSHYVAVPEDRDAIPVREFGCFTSDLQEMVDWLKSCGITTVAMEATGVYWVPVHQILERAKFDVVLVNAKDHQNLPGRKTDVQDCQWIQHLHELGLVRGSFRPEDSICVLRSYVRHRDTLVAEASRHIQRMQKALEQMNLQLHKVLSNVAGVTGMSMIKAIVAGERDPAVLVKLRHAGCRKDREVYIKALTGDYREEHLFCLGHELALYEEVQKKIAETEEKMQQCFAAYDQKNADAASASTAVSEGQADAASAAGSNDTAIGLQANARGKLDTSVNAPKRKPGARKGPGEEQNLRAMLSQMTGVDLTRIDGLGTTTVQKIISEVGVDMTKWPTEKHFASWLRLSPNNKITGGRVQSGRTLPTRNRAAASFRMAAFTLANSKSALGAYYRRTRAKKGGAHAVAATAHKLAKLVYRMLKSGEAYVDKGMDYYEQKYRSRMIKGAVGRLQSLGLGVTLTQNQALTGTVS
jgi:transposase